MIIKMLYFISGTLWGIELLPQLWKTYRTKSVKDIHIFFPLICFISFCIFFIASILAKNWILVFTHLMPFICNTAWLILTLIYRRKNDKK